MKKFLLLYKTDSTPFSSHQNDIYIAEWKKWINDVNVTGKFVSGSFFSKESSVIISGKDEKQKSYSPKSHKDILRGYMLFEAEDIKKAAEIVKQCPVFKRGGEVEIRELESKHLG